MPCSSHSFSQSTTAQKNKLSTINTTDFKWMMYLLGWRRQRRKQRHQLPLPLFPSPCPNCRHGLDVSASAWSWKKWLIVDQTLAPEGPHSSWQGYTHCSKPLWPGPTFQCSPLIDGRGVGLVLKAVAHLRLTDQRWVHRKPSPAPFLVQC